MAAQYMQVYKQMVKENNLIRINKMFLLKYKYNDPENNLIEPMKEVQGMEKKIDYLVNACQHIFGKVDQM